MFSRASCSTQNINYPCDPKLLAQHQTLITHVLQSSSLNTKHLINLVLHGPCSTQTSICISSIIGLRPIYKTNHHVHMQWVLGNRADPGLILLCRTNKRPTVLALSATTCAQVAVSPETAMGCRRISFLQAERGVTVP